MTESHVIKLGRRWVAENDSGKAGMLVRTEAGDAKRLTEDTRLSDVVGWPDFRDGATKGAALHVVREQWGDPGIFIRPRGSKVRPDWASFSSAGDFLFSAPTEEETLVVTLENACPPPKGMTRPTSAGGGVR